MVFRYIASLLCGSAMLAAVFGRQVAGRTLALALALAQHLSSEQTHLFGQSTVRTGRVPRPSRSQHCVSSRCDRRIGTSAPQRAPSICRAPPPTMARVASTVAGRLYRAAPALAEGAAPARAGGLPPFTIASYNILADKFATGG